MISLLKQIEVVGGLFDKMGEGYHLEVDFMGKSPKDAQELRIGLKRGTKGSIEFPFSRRVFVENNGEDVACMILEKALEVHDGISEDLTKEKILANVQYSLKGQDFLDTKKEANVLARKVLDLYVRYVVPDSGYNLYITENVLNRYGLTMEEVDAYAAKNLRDPGSCTCMELANALKSLGVDVEEDLEVDNNLYLLKHGEEYGASVILNKEFMSDFVCKKDVDFAFIIPSSIHEVLGFYPKKGEDAYARALTLKNLCKEVNKTVVSDKEMLSNSIYVADRNGNIFQIA